MKTAPHPLDPSRASTALGRLAARIVTRRRLQADRDAEAATADPESDAPAPRGGAWRILQARPDLIGGEVGAAAGAVAVVLLAGTAHAATRLVPDARWHWIWLAPAVIAVAFIVLNVLGLASAVGGAAARKCGFWRARRPAERTGIVFAAVLTGYAVWAAQQESWIALIALGWIALAAANVIAAAIEAALGNR